jgi:hypothetical protein
VAKLVVPERTPNRRPAGQRYLAFIFGAGRVGVAWRAAVGRDRHRVADLEIGNFVLPGTIRRTMDDADERVRLQFSSPHNVELLIHQLQEIRNYLLTGEVAHVPRAKQ